MLKPMRLKSRGPRFITKFHDAIPAFLMWPDGFAMTTACKLLISERLGEGDYGIVNTEWYSSTSTRAQMVMQYLLLRSLP